MRGGQRQRDPLREVVQRQGCGLIWQQCYVCAGPNLSRGGRQGLSLTMRPSQLASANGAMQAIDAGMVHALDAKLGSDKKAESNKGVQQAALDIAKVISEGQTDEEVILRPHPPKNPCNLPSPPLPIADLPLGTPSFAFVVADGVPPDSLCRR